MLKKLCIILILVLLPFIADAANRKADHIAIGQIRVSFGDDYKAIQTTTMRMGRPSEDVDYAFGLAKTLFQTGSVLPTQITIDTGAKQPDNDDLTFIITIPSSFLQDMPKNHEPTLFALIYQDGGMEVLDEFDPLPAHYDPQKKQLAAILPSYAFTNKRDGKETYEAILMIASTPGKSLNE